MDDLCEHCGKQPIEGCTKGFMLTRDLRCQTHGGEPTKEECEACDGSGWLKSSDQPCRNMLAKRLRDHLGPEIAAVKHVNPSPLLELGKKGEPHVRDLTNRNIHIKGCPYHNLLPHLKWVLGVKGVTFLFTVIDDVRIKDVFVGNENYRSRPVGKRNDIVTTNSLSDLVGSYDLVIILLGYLGYKNVSVAGALKEALLIRQRLKKATWIVEDPTRPWTHSKNADVEYYVSCNFNIVHIEPTADPGVEELSDWDLGIGTDEDDEEPQEAPAPYDFSQDTVADVVPVQHDDDFDMGPIGGGQ